MQAHIRLTGTPLSHFTRKIRLLLDHYGLAYSFVDLGDVACEEPANFCGNPLMSAPILEDDGVWLIESDHIAAFLVRKYDAADRFEVLTADCETLNARAILNGVMANQAKLILAERTGLATEPHAYFAKASRAISEGLAWLEKKAETFSAERPTYLGFHLVCMWDHLRAYCAEAEDFPKLAAIAGEISRSPLVAQSAPARRAPWAAKPIAASFPERTEWRFRP